MLPEDKRSHHHGYGSRPATGLLNSTLKEIVAIAARDTYDEALFSQGSTAVCLEGSWRRSSDRSITFDDTLRWPNRPQAGEPMYLFLFARSLPAFFAIFALLYSAQANAKIEYHVTFNDPKNALAANRMALLANLDAAVADWARFIASRGQVWIELSTVNPTPGHFGATSPNWARLSPQRDFYVFEGSGPHKLRTGVAVKPDQPDVIITIDPNCLRTIFWIDLHPDRRNDPVPGGKVDLVTAFAHELGHAFGIDGLIDTNTGRLPKFSEDPVVESASTFEMLVRTEIEPLFTGPKAEAVYGGPVPLIFFFNSKDKDVWLSHAGRRYLANLDAMENFYHIGRCNPSKDEGDLSFFSVMSGCWKFTNSVQGVRLFVNKLDAAILLDLGVPEAR